MKKQFIETGKIVGTHALKGEVRVDAWCDSVAFLCGLKRLYFRDGTELKVLSARPHKNVAIIQFDGVSGIESADRLRGKIVYMNRDDVKLPQGTHFIQDLIGLEVRDVESGEVYGTISDVIKTGANDVYAVQKDGKEYLVPVIPDVVKEKNIDGGYITIKVLEGIFDDEN